MHTPEGSQRGQLIAFGSLLPPYGSLGIKLKFRRLFTLWAILAAPAADFASAKASNLPPTRQEAGKCEEGELKCIQMTLRTGKLLRQHSQRQGAPKERCCWLCNNDPFPVSELQELQGVKVAGSGTRHVALA